MPAALAVPPPAAGPAADDFPVATSFKCTKCKKSLIDQNFRHVGPCARVQNRTGSARLCSPHSLPAQIGDNRPFCIACSVTAQVANIQLDMKKTKPTDAAASATASPLPPASDGDEAARQAWEESRRRKEKERKEQEAAAAAAAEAAAEQERQRKAAAEEEAKRAAEARREADAAAKPSEAPPVAPSNVEVAVGPATEQVESPKSCCVVL